MKDQLRNALLQRFPNMKDYAADRCVEKYIEATMREIATQFVMMDGDDFEQGEMDFSAEQTKLDAGRISVEGTMRWILPMMHEHQSTSLVIVVYEGNSITKRVSRVTFNPAYKKDIMEELQNLTIELNPKHLDNLEQKANQDIIVDPESLESYMQQTRGSFDDSKHKNYNDKLNRNLQIANALKGRIHTTADGVHFVSEYWEEIDSGRVYGHGLSLQRIPSEVRNAMLGQCHKYDFKASSFALMTSLAIQIDPTLKVAALTDYITQRSLLRKHIAADIEVGESIIKGVFTSLGFGANLKDNPYSSIRATLGQERYNKLMSNSIFALIAKQLADVSKVIDAAFPSTGFEFFGREYKPTDKDGKKRSKAQKLAWIYQCMERGALQIFIDEAPAAPMLTTHDCLYFKHALSTEQFADLNWKLRQKFSLLTFEHEAIYPIHTQEDHDARERAVLMEELAHRERIEEQEQLARTWKPVNSTIGGAMPKRMVDTPWGPMEESVWASMAPEQPKEEKYFKDSY